MISPANNFDPSDSGAPTPPRKRLPGILIALFVLASVLVPMIFWQGTWFGTRLSDAQLLKYLTERDNPRHVQHALVQLTERFDRKDPAVASFYPQMLALVDHPREEVRSTLAWTMGWDPQSEPFHEALRTLLADRAPLVARNAALSLSKFSDRACVPMLLAMLEPYAVPAPVAGELSDLPPQGRPVKAHSDLATITPQGEPLVKVKAPLDGRILSVEAGNGKAVAVGEILCRLAPGENDMREAFRALAIIGASAEVEAVRAALNRSYITPTAAEQGELTVKLIEGRK